jgi:DNA-binding CsgD family transcriptional regulator
MKHIDILIHGLTLLTGIMTALLGFLLYLKYKVREIWYYALFIFTTTFTVAVTTVFSYLSYDMGKAPYSLWHIFGLSLFEVFLCLINFSFSKFALGIIHKPSDLLHKALTGIPVGFIVLSGGTLWFSNLGKDKLVIPPIIALYFMMVLAFLFLSFVVYSVRIAINLKNIDNPDLKRALKVLALLFIIYIPIQALVISFKTHPMLIMLSRNLFYCLVNIISIVFAAKYFFIETPTIMDKIEISVTFLTKYGITNREKEIIELLLAGLAIKEISGKLDRSFKTVNNHIYNIYQKTGVSSKLELLNLIKENSI